MGTLKQQSTLSTDGFTSRYGGVPVLYLESEDDRYIYAERWFRDYQQKIEFTAVNQQTNASGCKAVIDHVQDQRTQGIPAWGLVDRDALMSKNQWDLVWETDDEKFNKTLPFGPHVKPTLLWELENYLVDMVACEPYLARSNRRAERPPEKVYQELFEQCEALVPHAAYNAMQHEFGKVQAGDGMTNNFANRQAVEDYIKTHFQPNWTPEEQNTYEENLCKVDQFDHPGGSEQQRFESLRRRVHGKALLSRLVKCHHLSGKACDHFGHLAEEISRAHRVSDELTSFLDQIVSS